jgi:hypothetical protein
LSEAVNFNLFFIVFNSHSKACFLFQPSSLSPLMAIFLQMAHQIAVLALNSQDWPFPFDPAPEGLGVAVVLLFTPFEKGVCLLWARTALMDSISSSSSSGAEAPSSTAALMTAWLVCYPAG